MAREDHYGAVQCVLENTIALCLFESKGLDSEEATPEHAKSVVESYPERVENARHAIMVIIDTACDEAVAEVVDRIRKAEGVDTVAVDAALGVQPDDEPDEQRRFDDDGNEIPGDDEMGTD